MKHLQKVTTCVSDGPAVRGGLIHNARMQACSEANRKDGGNKSTNQTIGYKTHQLITDTHTRASERGPISRDQSRGRQI